MEQLKLKNDVSSAATSPLLLVLQIKSAFSFATHAATRYISEDHVGRGQIICLLL
jgi:hypothetical protein